jgi:hypothetical protein
MRGFALLVVARWKLVGHEGTFIKATQPLKQKSFQIGKGRMSPIRILKFFPFGLLVGPSCFVAGGQSRRGTTTLKRGFVFSCGWGNFQEMSPLNPSVFISKRFKLVRLVGLGG